LNEKYTRHEVIGMLRGADAHLQRAVDFEQAGYFLLAWQELAAMFKDQEMLPFPNPDEVSREQRRKIDDERTAAAKRTGTPALLTGVGAGPSRERRDVKSWGL